jgi:hypothetical protein
MNIQIHTLQWRGDRSVRDGDDVAGSVTVYCRVFVNGDEIPQVIRARTYHGNDFAWTTLTLAGVVEIVNHTQESWLALPEKVSI